MQLHPLLLIGGQSAALPRRPALSSWCRVVHQDHRCLLERGGTVLTLEGAAASRLLPALLPLLDGTRTLEEIVSVLGRPVAPAIERALRLLDEHRLLVDGDDRAGPGSDVTAAAAAAAAVTRASEVDAADALRRARVAVLGEGAAAAATEEQLRCLGIPDVALLPLDRDPPSDAFVVAAPSSDESSALAGLNEAALARGMPWLQLLPFDGRQTVVGPLFAPGRSACRACFVLRRGACSGYEEDFDVIDREPLTATTPPPLASMGAALAAAIALRWVTASDPTLPGRYYAFEWAGVLRLRHGHVLRVPRCPACGSPDRAVPSPWFEAP